MNDATKPPTMQQRLARLASNGVCAVMPPPFIEAVVARIDPRTERATANKDGDVAIINVRGTIVPREDKYSAYFGEVGAEDTARRVEAAVADKKIKAVIVAYDSPGGNVAGVPEAVGAMRALRGRKPIVAQVDHTMASAAYWLAQAADEIVAAPSSGVGAVGVITMHVDQTKMLADMGITVTPYAKPADKADGWGYWANSDKFDARMNQMIAETYDQFVGDILSQRPNVTRKDVQDEWAGFYNAKRAQLLGMIDKVRGMSETFAAYTTKSGTQVARLKLQTDLYKRKGMSRT